MTVVLIETVLNRIAMLVLNMLQILPPLMTSSMYVYVCLQLLIYGLSQ